jgi:hypothetical protein
MQLSNDEYSDLRRAVELLENPSIAIKVIDLFGMPIEKGLNALPDKWLEKVGEATELALNKALNTAIRSMDGKIKKESSDLSHTVTVAFTGGVGGAFGLIALPFELPISTTIMLRSIADIARSEGEDINDVKTKLACLEVFALGGRPKSDDSADAGYYAIRGALAAAISDAAQHIAGKTANLSSPALINLIEKLAARFQIAVSEKVLATAVPIIGAAGGSLINTIFIDHFQDMALGHFTVRRLESSYDQEFIEQEYNIIREEMFPSGRSDN